MKKENTLIEEVANAIVLFDLLSIDMNDSYLEIVESAIEISKLNKENFRNLDFTNEEILSKIETLCYIEIAKKQPDVILDYINNLMESEQYEYLLHNLVYMQTETAKDSALYRSFNALYMYSLEYDITTYSDTFKAILKWIRTRNMNVIHAGYCLCHTYTKYLDTNRFGVIMNDAATVGNIIIDTTEDTPNNYEYKASLRINKLHAPQVTLELLFKKASHNEVVCDVKLGRIGYISETKKSIGVVKSDVKLLKIIFTPIYASEKNASLLAKNCNLIADYIMKKYNTKEFHDLLPYNEKFSAITNM